VADPNPDPSPQRQANFAQPQCSGFRSAFTAAFPADRGRSEAPSRLRAAFGAAFCSLRSSPLMLLRVAGASRVLPAGSPRCSSKEVELVDTRGGGERRARYGSVAVLPPRTLRELAALGERGTGPEVTDPVRAAAEIAEMLEQGTRPTIGWWRRHTAR